MTHKTVDTSLLRIAYDEWNAGAARSVVLLHGWPDSPQLLVPLVHGHATRAAERA